MAANSTSGDASLVPPSDSGKTLRERIGPAPPRTAEPSSGHIPDAERVRELLRRAGLSPRAAALELEIDEGAVRGYCTGRPVPRYFMLAIEHLADLRRTKVYHITTVESALDILARGFRDDMGMDMSASVPTGVWISDKLLVLLSDIDLDEMACFEMKVPEGWLLRYERLEHGKAYRKFLVPAAELNEFPRRRLPHKEWLSMPWGR